MQIPLTTSHLSCQLNNSKHGSEHTIYFSGDPAENVLTLVVSTDAKEAQFTPGTATSRGKAAGGTGSLLYLKLNDLHLTDAEFDRLKLTLDGWKSQNFKEGDNRLVCLTPTRPVTLKAGESLTFQFEQFALANKPPESFVNLTLFAWRVAPITRPTGADEATSHCGVNVLPPPDTHLMSLHDVLHVLADISKIVNSADEDHLLFNRLRLVFQAQGQPRPKIPVDQNTEFRLSFVYAEDELGFGALTTAEEARKIEVIPDPNVAANWTVTPVKDVQAPYWILKPTGSTLLGSDDFDFLIEEVATCFQPGPTTLYVQYSGIPGYQAGVYVQLLEKVPRVSVSDFHAEPATPAIDPNGEATVTLHWTADDATVLTLDWRAAERVTLAHRNALSNSAPDEILPPIKVTGLSSYSVTIRENTNFTLIAEGEKPDNLVDNRVLMHCVTVLKPTIEKFEVVLEDAARKAYRINWVVRGPQKTVVKLKSDGSLPERILPELSGSLSPVTIGETQTLTLTATAPGAPATEKNYEVLPAWQHTEVGALLMNGIDRTFALADALRVRFGGKLGENCAPEIVAALTRRQLEADYRNWAQVDLGAISAEQSWYGKTVQQWQTPPSDFPLGSFLPPAATSIVSLFDALAHVVSDAGTEADRDRWLTDVKAKLPQALEELHNNILASRPAALHKSLMEICVMDIQGSLPGVNEARPNIVSSQRFLAGCCLRYLIGLQVQGNAALLNALVQSGSVEEQKQAIRRMKVQYDAQEATFAGPISSLSGAFMRNAGSQNAEADWTRFLVLGQVETSEDKCIVGVRFANEDPKGPTTYPSIGVARLEDLLYSDAPPVEWVRIPESSRCDLSAMSNLTLDLMEIAAPAGSIVTGFGIRLVEGHRLAVRIKATSLNDAGQIQSQWISNDTATNESKPITTRNPQNLFHLNMNEIVPSPAAPLAGFSLYGWGNGAGVAALTTVLGWREALEALWRKRTTTAQILLDHNPFSIWIVPPTTIHVPRGTVVTWQNNGGNAMWVQFGDKPVNVMKDLIQEGQSKALTLNDRGIINYTCRVAMFWTASGTVIVV